MLSLLTVLLSFIIAALMTSIELLVSNSWCYAHTLCKGPCVKLQRHAGACKGRAGTTHAGPHLPALTPAVHCWQGSGGIGGVLVVSDGQRLNESAVGGAAGHSCSYLFSAL